MSSDDLPPKPSRPFTEYHIFFQLERNYILQNSFNSPRADAAADLRGGGEDVDPHASSRPPRYRSLVLPRDWHTKGSRPKRRSCRKAHGKVSFVELTKLISRRWRGVDAATRSYCRDLAERELGRYREEMRGYVERYGEGALRQAKQQGRRQEGDGREKKRKNRKKDQGDQVPISQVQALPPSHQPMPPGRNRIAMMMSMMQSQKFQETFHQQLQQQQQQQQQCFLMHQLGTCHRMMNAMQSQMASGMPGQHQPCQAQVNDSIQAQTAAMEWQQVRVPQQPDATKHPSHSARNLLRNQGGNEESSKNGGGRSGGMVAIATVKDRMQLPPVFDNGESHDNLFPSTAQNNNHPCDLRVDCMDLDGRHCCSPQAAFQGPPRYGQTAPQDSPQDVQGVSQHPPVSPDFDNAEDSPTDPSFDDCSIVGPAGIRPKSPSASHPPVGKDLSRSISPTPDYNIAPEISFLAKNFVDVFSRYLDHDHDVESDAPQCPGTEEQTSQNGGGSGMEDGAIGAKGTDPRKSQAQRKPKQHPIKTTALAPSPLPFHPPIFKDGCHTHGPVAGTPRPEAGGGPATTGDASMHRDNSRNDFQAWLNDALYKLREG